jgi:hypothetical protein
LVRNTLDTCRTDPIEGSRVIIDGICLSACTLAVGILPHGRVCVTAKAVLGFQAAWKPPPGLRDISLFRIFAPPRSLRLAVSKEDRIPNAAATQLMMNNYPPVLQQWINQHGGLAPKLIYLRDKELAAIRSEVLRFRMTLSHPATHAPMPR